MPNFFIDRPIFAWVIAIIIMLAGGLAILKPTRALMRKRCRIPLRRLSNRT
ncbi:hydrophobe/amphiphile efflux-1 (HAE1) family protein [Enterobacter cloacae]|nr:hydrophobe/amphiphile efflux-1 (HAE1) family protein [Enterobacter cloacae]